MSATETPLVTPGEINKILTAENADLRMREQVGKEANDRMRAELEKAREELAHVIETNETEAAIDAEEKRKLRADLAARDALMGDLRDFIRAQFHADGCMCEASFAGPGTHVRHSDECRQAHALLARTPADAGAELVRLRKLADEASMECVEQARALQLVGAERDALREEIKRLKNG